MIVRPGDTAFLGVDNNLSTDEMENMSQALKELSGASDHNIHLIIVRGLRTGFILRTDEVG